MSILRTIVIAILTWEARLVLWRYQPKIIAVTGSMGKTTAKDAIFAALSSTHHIRKSAKSFNSEIGVPLTILGSDSSASDPLGWLHTILRGAMLVISKQSYPEWLVLEVGADKPGDIRATARWIKPDVAVVTGVPDVPVHVEFFSSPDEVFEEKKSLIEYVKPGGKLVLNGDDERLRAIKAERPDDVILYGFNMACTVIAWQDAIMYNADGRPTGMSFTAIQGETSLPVEVTGALGRPRVYGALAALAVAVAVGKTLPDASEGLKGWEPPRGRMRIIEGVHDSVLVDDTYNSSPAAVISALETLKDITGAENHIAVLGDMLELGKYSADAHRTVGEYAAEQIDVLVTVGIRARATAEAAEQAGMSPSAIHMFEQGQTAEAAQAVKALVRKGDVVLIKGSQSMRMERVAEALMANPEKAQDILVRQEEEWKRRK